MAVSGADMTQTPREPRPGPPRTHIAHIKVMTSISSPNHPSLDIKNATETVCYQAEITWLSGLCVYIRPGATRPILSTESEIYVDEHDMVIQCWYNVGPPSTTLAQHYAGIAWAFCFYWDLYLTGGQLVPYWIRGLCLYRTRGQLVPLCPVYQWGPWCDVR